MSARDLGSEGVLLLTGPTCAGKSALALALAERFDGEIVGADSRQIYRDMPIGTAAPTAAQRARVPHHLVGFLDPHERYSAARYVRDALGVISAIRARGKRALVVGGTGFYLRALAGDVVLSAAYDPALRARLALEARLHPPDVLHAWLAARAPLRAAAISERDPYRITRALEIALSSASVFEVKSDLQTRSLRDERVPFMKVALDISPASLAERIEGRVDDMLARGLVAEAERIGPGAIAADAVGYPEALAYLGGLLNARELRALLVRSTRRYAKRQRTWFGSEPELVYAAAEELEGLVTSKLDWRPSYPARRKRAQDSGAVT